MDRGDQRRRGGVSGGLLDELPDRSGVDATQRNAPAAGLARELAKHAGQGLAPPHLDVAVRADQQDARAADLARQELQQQ